MTEKPERRAPSKVRDDPARGYSIHEQIGTILRIANQNAVNVFDEVIAEMFGHPVVTTTQFAVLVTLWADDGLSHTAIAERTVMDMPTLHSVLKRLEVKGFVTSRVDARDRRRRIVFLTEAGRDLACELRNVGTRISDRILAPFDAEKRRLFLELLAAFNAPRSKFPAG